MMKKLYISLFLLLLASCSENNRPQEIWIKNTDNESIYLQLSGNKDTDSPHLAIIQHGLASNMEHPAVQTAKQAFLDKGYLVITFDSRHSLGKSDGKVINVRLETFENDLETVINWAKKQKFYREPLTLAGHSLGGASVLQYAAGHPSGIDRIIPITPVVSGNRWEKSCMTNMTDFCQNWKQNGVYNYQTEIIPYAVVEDAKAYDALQLTNNIKARTLLITVKDDNIIAPHDVKELYDAFAAPKSFGSVSDGGHNFATEQSRRELYDLIIGFLP